MTTSRTSQTDGTAPPAAPERLLDGRGPEGVLLRRADSEARRGLDEAEAWKRLCRRLPEHGARTPPGARTLMTALAAGAAVAAVVVVTKRPPATLPAPVAPMAERAAAPEPEARREQGAVARLEPNAEATPVPVGRTRIGREAVVALDAGGRASVLAVPAETRFLLDRGRLSLDVGPRGDRATPLVVAAGPYRLVVVGTVFHVTVGTERVELGVSEGKVSVRRGEERLALVGAGERWSGPLGDEVSGTSPRGTSPRGISPSAVPSKPAVAALGEVSSATARAEIALAPSSVVEPSPGPPDRSVGAPTPMPPPARPVCAALAREGRTGDAVQCFEAEADSAAGLTAEVALYEAARLRGGALAEPAAALAALTRYRERFPDGSLRHEVAVSMVELLPRVGRHREALAESERLLAVPEGRERAAELRLLRGNIHREVFRDLARAETEYAAAAAGSGEAAREARFLLGVCREAAGRGPDAADAYRAYLAEPGATRAAEARRRLENLRP